MRSELLSISLEAARSDTALAAKRDYYKYYWIPSAIFPDSLSSDISWATFDTSASDVEKVSADPDPPLALVDPANAGAATSASSNAMTAILLASFSGPRT